MGVGSLPCSGRSSRIAARMARATAEYATEPAADQIIDCGRNISIAMKNGSAMFVLLKTKDGYGRILVAPGKKGSIDVDRRTLAKKKVIRVCLIANPTLRRGRYSGAETHVHLPVMKPKEAFTTDVVYLSSKHDTDNFPLLKVESIIENGYVQPQTRTYFFGKKEDWKLKRGKAYIEFDKNPAEDHLSIGYLMYSDQTWVKLPIFE